MKAYHIMTMACSAMICGGVLADANETANVTASARWNWAKVEGVAFVEKPVVSAEVSLAFDSKFLSYGLVDNNDPILTPAVALTFFDRITFGVESIFDISHYGKNAGYGDRSWRYQEFDPGLMLFHTLEPDEAEWLPTTVEFELGYVYEAHPKIVDADTQFLNYGIGLPDLWFEPAFNSELDLQRDHGTYLNLELGHTFKLIGPCGDNGGNVLDLRLSVAQGWGGQKRIEGYLPHVGHAGLMDFVIKGALSWTIADGVTLGAYLAYSDFLFNRDVRTSARGYEATGSWTKSWNIVSGISLSVVF